jgi:hypothetical protein
MGGLGDLRSPSPPIKYPLPTPAYGFDGERGFKFRRGRGGGATSSWKSLRLHADSNL